MTDRLPLPDYREHPEEWRKVGRMTARFCINDRMSYPEAQQKAIRWVKEHGVYADEPELKIGVDRA